jgi:hypothetical protein
MGLINISFGRKKAPGFDFTDKERQEALEIRQLNAKEKKELLVMEWKLKKNELELRRLEQETQIQELREELGYNEDGNSPDNMFTGLLSQVFNGQVKQPLTNLTSQKEETPLLDLTEEQIEEAYRENKKYVKYAKKMSDEQIKAFVRTRIPNLSDKSMDAIIARVRR